MKPITFCIASANNEREYTHLLLDSLQQNTDISKHEILIFIDSDNQNTYESLLEKQKELPNMRIHRNTIGFPIGSQRNVSIMFNAATNDIVCYLQSDMVVGKDFDKHISNNMQDQNVVLSCARIEPPLHPESPDKITKDFGMTPETFNWEKFNLFVSELQSQNRPNIKAYFAPFAMYKKTYLDIMGGFDTQFRCSREDTDFSIRLTKNGLQPVQSWNACVYHFTCVSSRGKDWFKKDDEEAKYKNEIQYLADLEEIKRLIRKWGQGESNIDYVYDVGLTINLDRFVNIDFLKGIEPFFSNISISRKEVVEQLISQLEYDSTYYSNLRWNYTHDYWQSIKHLFNPMNFSKRILHGELNNDVIISCNYSDIHNKQQQILQIIQNIQRIIHENPEGKYEVSNLVIEIKRKNNKIESLLKPSNLNDILTSSQFEFI